jgi:hypothetical protein
MVLVRSYGEAMPRMILDMGDPSRRLASAVAAGWLFAVRESTAKVHKGSNEQENEKSVIVVPLPLETISTWNRAA